MTSRLLLLLMVLLSLVLEEAESLLATWRCSKRLPRALLRTAPPPTAKAVADSRYRKSTALYEQLEEGRGAEGEPLAAPVTKPVLLAPAGGWPQVEAAIKAGANAIYFGCAAGLNARARATNFGEEELPALMERLHAAGLEGYMCVNVLIYESEMAQAEQLARSAEAAGVDGLIVQDVGLASRLHAVAPSLPLHASTQMSISDADGARFAAESLGARTVVLTRELSIDDISAVTAAVPDANVEVFVHGHMCVSYNGQCFSSEAWGGRSANRGQCAQQCRMPYGLMVDGELREVGDASRYLLSPQDLCGIDHVPRLLDAGVRTFKIEGRLKSAEYVYVSTLAYRRAIDEAWAALEERRDGVAGAARDEGGASSGGGDDGGGDDDGGDHSGAASPPPLRVRDEVAKEERATPAPLPPDALRQVFARAQDAEHDGHTPGFFDGSKHQTYVRGLSPSHRGVCAGTVVARPHHNTVRVRLTAELSAGDGVAFGAASSDAGGTLWSVHDGTDEADGEVVTLEMEDATRLEGVAAGDLVWRTQHVALQRQLKGALADPAAGRALVDVKLEGAIGEPIAVTITDGRGRSTTAQTEAPLQPASGAPLTEAALRKAVGQLGGTPLMVRHLSVDAELMDGAWLPLSSLKEARRVAVESLVALRGAQRVRPPPPRATSEAAATATAAAAAVPSSSSSAAAGGGAPLHLSVLCRTHAQVVAAAACPDVDEIVIDFLELDGIREALAAARPKATVVAAPRIIKPAEEALWRVLLELREADALLVRSAGLLDRLRALAAEGGAALPAVHADFSLNVANSAAAAAFLSLGVARLAPTFDLDATQLCDLAAALPAAERDKLEVIVHAHVPIFHTEHCVFANRLSAGDSYKDCGHPCTRHSLHLVDEQQKRHHVLADSGCRNTIFNAQPQTAALYLATLRAAGVRHMRVELTDQPGELVAPLVERYAALARGRRGWRGWRGRGRGRGRGRRGGRDGVARGESIDSTGHRPGVTLGSFSPLPSARGRRSGRPRRRRARMLRGADAARAAVAGGAAAGAGAAVGAGEAAVVAAVVDAGVVAAAAARERE